MPVARTPVRVELRIKATFRASTSDPRSLGAQVGFKFVPAKQQRSTDARRVDAPHWLAQPARSHHVEVARGRRGPRAARAAVARGSAWGREEAAYEYFVTRLRTRPDVIGPFAAFVCDGDGPVAALAGRIESRRLKTALGYKVVYAPLVRLLQVVDGGHRRTPSPAALAPLARALRARASAAARSTWSRSRRSQLGSELFRAFDSLGGPSSASPSSRRGRGGALALPATFDEFVASRGAPNTRWRSAATQRQLAARSATA